ncbi:separase [Spizellomyces punctatus DAOM BR117]|uniref:separase n=1 Tax=Spizellomyces punctatus (strain DAOM BR117) TaxID=645134 RepID=A0A0L0HPE0_SPIPD|nr:separase [Spizellomyces punctatus DAOM BR117]KND03271.1 hypothetical protein SPPG_02321 [Spizellomyces punctatus DAOM BR117]|eukprot:XP_016611310.1 hypothetical protein SPPG_02321 [Spizellomyces punctatus DAOM BR117]
MQDVTDTTSSDSAEALLLALSSPGQCTGALSMRIRAFLAPALQHGDVSGLSSTAGGGSATRIPKRRGTGSKVTVGTTTTRASLMQPLETIAARLGPFAMKVLNQAVRMLTACANEKNANKVSSTRSVPAKPAEVSPATCAPVRKTKTATKTRPRFDSTATTKAGRTTMADRNGVNLTVEQCLADCSECSLEALSILQRYLTLNSLDLEKVACNIASRLVDLGELDRGLKLLMYIHRRLWIENCTSPSTTPSLNGRRRPAASTRGRKLGTTIESRFLKSAKGQSSSSSKTNCNREGKEPRKGSISESLLQLPSICSPDSCSARLSLGLMCMTVALKCWLLDQANRNAIVTEQLLMKPFGIYSLCKLLKTMDEVNGAKSSENVFRLLYRTSLNENEWDPQAALNLRKLALAFYVESSGVTYANFAEQVFKFGMAFEHAGKSLDANQRAAALLDFYIASLDLAEKLLETGQRPQLASCKWCDHCVYVAKKMNRADIVTRTLKHARMVMKATDDRISTDIASCAFLTFNRLEALALKFTGAVVRQSDPEEAYAAADELESSLRELTKTLQVGECAEGTAQTVQHFIRSIDTVVKMSGEIASKPDFDENSLIQKLETRCWRPVFMGLVQLNEILQTKNAESGTVSDADLRKLVPGIVACFNTLGRIDSGCGLQGKGPFLDHLKAAAALSAKHAFEEGLRSTANTCYFLGGIFYKEKHWEMAGTLFSLSCDVLGNYLDGVTESHKTTSAEVQLQVSKRYELCSICYSMLHDYETSLMFIKKAILQLLSLPVVESAEDSAPPDPALLRLVDRYVKTRTPSRPYIPLMEFVGGSDSPGQMEKVIPLAEYELKLLQGIEGNPGIYSGQTRLIDGLLDWYQEQSFPIRRSRMLLEKAEVLRTCDIESIGSVSDAEALCKAAIELLKASRCNDSYGNDRDRINECDNDLALAYSYLGMCMNDQDRYQVKPFTIALQIWKRLLVRVPQYTYNAKPGPKKPKASAFFADLRATYHHIRRLTDYFEMLNQPLNRILCGRLLLRLTTLLRDTDDLRKEAATLYGEIGFAYILLGYTGQAGVALAHGRMLVDSGQCTTEGSTFWQLCYSFYLCCIGNQSKSETTFKKVKPPQPSSQKDGRRHVVFGTFSRSVHTSLPAFAFFVHAYICFGSGSLAGAIADAERCLRLLSKEVKSLKSRSEGLSEITNAMSTLSLTGSQKGSKAEALYGKILCSAQWHFVHRFLSCYMWLGQLYVRQGSVMEAEHFYREGLELATLVHSQIFMSAFLLGLAEVDYRCYRLTESAQQIDTAVECQENVSPDVTVRDVVQSKIHKGDQQLRGEEYDEALNCFLEAEILLDEAMTDAVITNLEEKDLRGTETPRERKIIHLSPAKRKALSSSRLAQEKSDIQYECAVLSEKKVEIISRIGWALCKQGKLETSEKKLMSADDFLHRGLGQAEYTGALAKVKLQKLLQALRTNPLFTMFSDSAFSLPWCVSKRVTTSSSRQTKAFKAAVAVQRTIAQVQELFKEAFASVYPYGSPQLCHEISHGLALLNVMRAYLTGGTDDSDASDLALSSALYLELSKGLTSRREMLASVRDKLLRRSGQSSWPVPMSEIRASITDGEVGSAATENIAEECTHGSTMTISEFRDDIINALPEDWIVCSLSVDLEREDMYLTRLEKGSSPVVVRLPLKRQAMREGEDNGLLYGEVIGELQDILTASNATTENADAYVTREDKAEWWKKRKELDQRLKALLEEIELVWLGAFRGLLITDEYDSPSCTDVLLEFKEKVEKIIFKAVSTKAGRGKRASVLPIDSDLCRMLLRLGPDPSPDDIEDALFHLMDAYQYSGTNVDYDELNIDLMESDMRDALVAFHETYQNVMGNTSARNKPSRHLILIPDKHLHMIPWESLPVLRNRPVCRLPSIFFLQNILLQLKKQNLVVDPQKTYYLLNPSQDLVRTQEQFQEMVTSQEGWSGLISRAPSEDDWASALSSKDLFIYFGHGGGEQYIRGHRVRELDRCAVTLLLGCSSGCLRPAGEFDPHGTPLNYILGGSQAIVANLWDVTDRDLDRFSCAMFEKWGLVTSRETGHIDRSSIAEAVTTSRDVCTLKYLTGAAPVVYGVPVYLKR